METMFAKNNQQQPSTSAFSSEPPRNEDLRTQNQASMNPNITGMHELISVVNKLQNVFSDAGLSTSMELPQIVVVGSQSAGKSSVLESFVGKVFLPRGENIVTRCPLVIQMVTDEEQEYCEFLQEPAETRRKYTDFLAVRQEILNEMQRVAPGKNISPNPINLCIHSPDVLNLTVVDLPGITQAKIAEQPDGIQQQIKNVVLNYAKPDNALILAVSEGISDIANSTALNVAQEVDPQGKRTISVITKLDLVVKNKDAREVLANKLIHLELGHVGVVNYDLNERDLPAARKAEREFFRSHPAYHDIADRCGTQFLQAVLNVQLGLHIGKHLPRLRETLWRQLQTIQAEAEEYKRVDNGDQATLASRQTTDLIAIVQGLAKAFESAMEATSNVPDIGGKASADALSGGALINKLFYDVFPVSMKAVEKFQSDNYEREIATRIRNVDGIRVGVFAPQKAFFDTVRERIVLMKQPSIECVNNVEREVSQTFAHLVDNSNIRYPALRGTIKHMVDSHLSQGRAETVELIESFFGCQSSYININHKDFPSMAEILKSDVPGNSPQNRPNANSENGVDGLPSKVSTPEAISRKGYLTMTMTSGGAEQHKQQAAPRKLWFVLTNTSLKSFVDDEESVQRNSMPLGETAKRCRIRGNPSDPTNFTLYINPMSDGTNGKESIVNFVSDSESDALNWLTDFARVGVACDNLPARVANGNSGDASSSNTHGSTPPGTNQQAQPDNVTPTSQIKPTEEDLQIQDPRRAEQINTIYKMVLAYMPIMSETVRDFVPKCISYILIDGLIKFLRNDCLNKLQQRVADEQPIKQPKAGATVMRLMQEPQAVIEHRKQTILRYEATQKALKIIAETTLPDGPALLKVRVGEADIVPE